MMASRSASTLVAGARRCAPVAASTPRIGTAHLQSDRAFSTSPSHQKTTKGRLRMYKWMEKSGDAWRESVPSEDGPDYLGSFPNQPFPWNPYFRSEPVLGEKMRDQIYHDIRVTRKPIKLVSIELGVDVRRIAAVVRMKDIESKWQEEGKELATPYARAMMKLLPVHHQGRQFEPINELHVHKLTQQQLYVPVAESRKFTREDAAKAFHPKMLPPDQRAPNHELIDFEKALLAGQSREQARVDLRKKIEKDEEKHRARVQAARDEDDQRTSIVNNGRFEFRIKDVNMERAGPSGRGRHATGYRYGVPLNDRKKGAVKIPTSMP